MINQRLAKRVETLEESATIKMAQLARSLRESGKAVINLSLGEPDFDTPDFIKQAAAKALDQGYTKYPPVPGYQDLREAIAQKFRDQNSIPCKPSQVVVSNGAKQCIANAVMGLIDNGDEVIIFTPYWVSYAEVVRLAGGVPVLIETGLQQDFKVAPHQLAEALNQQTRMIIFSSPSNPTGSYYSLAELEEFAAIVRSYPNVLVLSDEIYEYIYFNDDPPASIGSLPGMSERTITVNGFSKGYAMTGWRLGYMTAPQWISEICIKIQGQFTSGANSFGQRAALAAIQAGPEAVKYLRNLFKERRDIVMEGLAGAPGLQYNQPPGAFYIFSSIRELIGKSYRGEIISDSAVFCELLLAHRHVATVDGGAFGAEGHFRISYAASDDDLREACKRIVDFTREIS